MNDAMHCSLSPLMRDAIGRLTAEWGACPHEVYPETLRALEDRGLVETQFVRGANGARWQYRTTAAARSEA